MLSEKLEAALNAPINAEFWSAYLYLSMAAHFAADGKPGFANWFEIQFKEGKTMLSSSLIMSSKEEVR